MSSDKVDVLVLGPTGYTGEYGASVTQPCVTNSVFSTPPTHVQSHPFQGKFVIQYLAAHPIRAEFSLGIGGRDLQKLETLKKALPNSANISVFAFDITDHTQVENVVTHAKVIVNCIGPFWKWSTPVVKYGIHSLQLPITNHRPHVAHPIPQGLFRERSPLCRHHGRTMVDKGAYCRVSALSVLVFQSLLTIEPDMTWKPQRTTQS